ncbi:MAG: MBL fold metallo-hydrolase [Solirubrobacteraceae bacterium]
MELTILGKSPAMPDAGGANSGYLLREGEFTLLIDCGAGVFSKLRALADPLALDAVLITHLHADHVSDLIPLGHALSFVWRESGRRPVLWGPPEGIERFAQLGVLLGAAGLIANSFHVHEYDPDQSLQLGPFTVSFAQVPHYVPTWACDLRSAEGRRLTFGADCAPNEVMTNFASGTDLLMLEATEGPEPPRPGALPNGSVRGHLSSREAGEMAAWAKAKRLLLTHYSDQLDGEQLRSSAQAVFDGSVLLACEGDRHVV